MAINPEAVGAVGEPSVATWTSKDCLLYAVGVGAGTSELVYTTENSHEVRQQVLPTFPVIAGFNSVGGSSPMSRIGSFNPAMLVHGTEAITLHKPIPVEGSVELRRRIAAIHDKVKAAVVVTETEAIDRADGSLMFTEVSSVFIRGEGGWGGDRGPSGPRNEPPAREPDHEVVYRTLPEQALIYRLSGDRNPLHSDPHFASMAGFPAPILHGLCTYGFSGRALLHSLCGGDASRFRHIEGRFSAPVFPGESLTVRVWVIGDGEAVFTTAVEDRTVIDQGLVRFA